MNSYYRSYLNGLTSHKNNYNGLIMALLIISLWGLSLVWLLNIDPAKLPLWLLMIAIVWQAFLYTGLFITAHDAIHGLVFPQNKKINHFIGSLAVSLYAFFSYKQLFRKHWLHHNHPASELDPDYHDGQRSNGFSWYFHFMKGYWSLQQLISMTIAYNIAKYVVHIDEINLILFCLIPPLISSIQLFYFGTFLPHREPEEGYNYPHCAQTIPLPVFWSFLACYHFGYHEEHHQFPQVPWWQLAQVHEQKVLQYCAKD